MREILLKQARVLRIWKCSHNELQPKPDEPTPNQSSQLTKNIKNFQKIPQRVRNPKKKKRCMISTLDEEDMSKTSSGALNLKMFA